MISLRPCVSAVIFIMASYETSRQRCTAISLLRIHGFASHIPAFLPRRLAGGGQAASRILHPNITHPSAVSPIHHFCAQAARPSSPQRDYACCYYQVLDHSICLGRNILRSLTCLPAGRCGDWYFSFSTWPEYPIFLD
jgi:hypothetical protein